MTRMSRVRVVLAAVILLLAPTLPCRAGAAKAFSQGAALDRFISSSMRTWKVPGAAVVIVWGTAPVYMKGFGVRNLNTRQPVTPDTLFAIGSCTKAFTTAAIAMLVDEGKMQWDGKVRLYIPFFHLYDPLADENVTMRDLLTHRTGVPPTGLLWYGSSFTREEIVRRLAYAKPNAGFRARFQYQNAMYIVAGYSVGQASGGTWDEFVKRRIFDPLAMSESDTSVTVAQRSPNFAMPYATGHHGQVKAIPWRNIDDAGPAGSINSSVRDMAKWITLQLNSGVFQGRRVISERNMAEMHTPQMVIPLEGSIAKVFFPDSMQLTYGLGWFIQDYRGHQLILHPGDIDGFSALVTLIPEIDTGYAVLINLGGGTYRQVLGYHIADMLLHLTPIDWSAHFSKLQSKFEAEQAARRKAWQSRRRPGTHPSRELAAYSGSYENPLYGQARVALENGNLVLHFHSRPSKLEHFQYDTFVVHMPEPTRLTFTLDDNGDVAEFSVDGIRFKREAVAKEGVKARY